MNTQSLYLAANPGNLCLFCFPAASFFSLMTNLSMSPLLVFRCVSSSITLNFTDLQIKRHLALFSLLQACMDLRDFGIKGLRDLGI